MPFMGMSIWCTSKMPEPFSNGTTSKAHVSVPIIATSFSARYLAEKDVAMIGTDTWAFEVVPFEKGSGIFEVHQILIPMNGIHILENINTEELVKDQAWEFLFTLGAARITGGVQAIINPIAIK